MHLHNRIGLFLKEHFDPHQSPHDAELRNWNKSFLPDAVRQDIVKEFAAGNGRELLGDISKPNSSSALVLNAFAMWKTLPKSIVFDKFANPNSLSFEKRCPIFKDSDIAPAHLDVLIEFDNSIMAIESKFTEYMLSPNYKFALAYDSISDERSNTPWFKQIRKDPQFMFLKADQLIKHALGLMRCYPGRRIELIYMYWEPKNAQEFSQFDQHQREIMRFTDMVSGCERISFQSLTYARLWESWDAQDSPDWLNNHVDHLLKRYDFAIPTSYMTI